jgi:hypothetical protein
VAEVLILKRKHFAEDTKPAEWSDLKWSGRPLRGDIIEVRPNGYFRVEYLGEGEHGWNRDAFCLIRLPKVSEATIAYITKSYSNATNTTPEKIRYKHQYRIVQWKQIPWQKHTVTVGGKTFEEWYIDVQKFNDVNITNKVG